MPDLTPYTELGSSVIITLAFIWAFVQYCKLKKNPLNGSTNAILTELQKMNNNHLHSLQECVENGNRELRDTIHDDNTKIIEILARIDGRLSK